MEALFHLLDLSPLYATVFDFLIFVRLTTPSDDGDDMTLSSKFRRWADGLPELSGS